MSPRLRLGLAKGVVKFLSDDDSKVLEFWQIWSESIPHKEDLTGIDKFVKFNLIVIRWIICRFHCRYFC